MKTRRPFPAPHQAAFDFSSSSCNRSGNQLSFRLPGMDLLPDEIVVDSFAGGGGASLGIEAALGRSPDIAINHDPEAIRMHELNHPSARHFQENVWTVKPKVVTAGRRVGLLWASPDCRHFSRAKGGKPVSPRVRGLAWVVVSWARQVRPRVICLENVPEFLTWGPLGPDNMPIKARAGETYEKWASQLRRLGYVLDKKILNAADFGAPTSRKRIFIVARRDGLPIRWPEPSHGPGRGQPHRSAAECVNWNHPIRSIFEPGRDLATATKRRSAVGTMRHILGAGDDAFLVNLTHGARVESGRDPFRTITGAHRGEKALVVPALSQFNTRSVGREINAPAPTSTDHSHTALLAGNLIQIGYGEREGQAPRVLDIRKPLGTPVAGGVKHALGAAVLKNFGGVVGQSINRPAGTITQIDHHSVLAANMVIFHGTGIGADLAMPAPVNTAGGGHLGLAAASVIHFYGEGGQNQSLSHPLHTIPTRDRHGLVAAVVGDDIVGAVRVALFLMEFGDYKPDTWMELDGDLFPVAVLRRRGAAYLLVDLLLRMFQPDELAKAQGFPDNYILIGTKSQKVAKIGNSVCPPVAEALVRANLVAQPFQMEAMA